MTNLKAHHHSTFQGIRYGFLDRTGGVSRGLYDSLNCGLASNDNPNQVRQNLTLVKNHFEADTLFTLKQVHGEVVVEITPDSDPDVRDQGDGLITTSPRLALGVLTADCAPVLLCDPTQPVIAVAHAGWRGAVSALLPNVITAMLDKGANHNTLHALIGPTIGPQSYQVGQEFMQRIMTSFPNARQYFSDRHLEDQDRQTFFNLPGFIESRLRSLNVTRVTDLGIDTYAHQNFFSHRRKVHRGEPDYGRQISVMMIE